MHASPVYSISPVQLESVRKNSAQYIWNISDNYLGLDKSSVSFSESICSLAKYLSSCISLSEGNKIHKIDLVCGLFVNDCL